MASPTPADLKKELLAAGFEIFRISGVLVHLADRVRENLIMDSGVAAVTGDALGVRLVVRVQGSRFPGEDAGALFDRARALAGGAIARGYAEQAAAAVPVPDPGGGPATLETWYELTLERPVPAEMLIEELRFALALDKVG